MCTNITVIYLYLFSKGHEMAKNLATAKINTTLITECQIGTIMPRVNKVIIGTHSFMANGGYAAHFTLLNIHVTQ